MKILNPVGSKERFLEMFQGVNKMRLNEVSTSATQSGTQLIENAFDELKNGVANVKQTNTQTVGEDNFVEIITNDNEGNEITFKFKINSNETNQDGVYDVNNAVLSQFKINSQTLNVDMPENMKAVEEFNVNRGNEIMGVVSEYANFETDTMSVDDTETAPVDDEMYEEAVRFIDKVPYKKGTEQMQTNKAYADQKPTNPDVRVNSNQLDKFVTETGDYDEPEELEVEDDPMALPPEFTDNDIPDADIKGINPLDQEMVDNEPLEQLSPEKIAIIHQASENLAAAGNDAPTTSDILAEIDRLQGKTKSVEKTRAVPKGAEEFYEGSGHVIDDIKANDVVKQGYENLLTPDKKNQLIFQAQQLVDDDLGALKNTVPRDMYIKAVKATALELFGNEAMEMNEESDKISKDYPDQMGKKFKPKNQMPKKKKRPQSVVKLSEEEYEKERKYAIEKEREKDPRNFENPKDPYGEDGEPYDFENGTELEENYIDEEPELNFNDIGGGIGDGGIAEENVEQVEKEKEEVGDIITGGKADKKKPQDFDKEQIKMGLKVEMEHTDDPMVAIEITMDHLTEFPDYYTRLDKMEKQAKGDTKSEGLVDNTPEEEEMTDELLGYKPHNVSDYTDEEFDYASAERDYADREDMEQNPEDYENSGEEQPEEIIDEEGLSDYVDTPGSTEIWYVKPEYFRDFIHGYDDLQKYSPDKIPNSNNLEKTHVLLGTIGETDPETIFHKLNNWGGEEVNKLLKTKGLDHTSMSVGDIVKIGGKAMMVDGRGFKDLGGGDVDNVSTTGGVAFDDTSSTIAEEDGMDEYQGEIGDRYQDGDGNQFTVRQKVNGGVTLQGQGGEKEIATRDIQFLKKLGEGKKVKKEVITEEQVKMARQALNKRGLNEGMTKKEAVQILIKHNIK